MLIAGDIGGTKTDFGDLLRAIKELAFLQRFKRKERFADFMAGIMSGAG